MAAKKSSSHNNQTTLRHVWLAALGAASVARREARVAAEIVLDETAGMRHRAMDSASDTRDIAPVQEQAGPELGKFAVDVEAVFAPLIGKLGSQAKPARPVRKTRKSSAKKTSGGSACARHADERVVRKGR